MNSKRSLLGLVIALTTIACMAPGAQAEVFLSDEQGVLEVGAEVTATSTNVKVTRLAGTYFQCAKMSLHLELVDAGDEHLQFQQVGALTTLGCIFNRESISFPNLPATLDDSTVGVGEGGTLTVDTEGKATSNFAFLGTIFADAEHKTLAAACSFGGVLELEATETTSNQLTATPSTLNGPCGEATLEGEFELETEDGDPVYIHYGEPPPGGVRLSDGDGTLKAGAEFTATSEEIIVTRQGGTFFECAEMTFHFELIDAGTEHLQFQQVGALTTVGCIFNRESLSIPNLPATLDDGTVGVGEGGTLTMDKEGKATSNFAFLGTIFADAEHKTLAAACSFGGVLELEATETTSNQLTATPSTLSGPCGDATIEGEIELETENGDPVYIHHDGIPVELHLSDSEGTLEAGAEVTATSEDIVMPRPDASVFECEEMTFHFELTDAGPEHLELEQIEGPAASEGCVFNREAMELPNLPMTIQDGTVGAGEGGVMTVDQSGATTTSLTFVGEFFTDIEHKTKVAECHFGGAMDLAGVKSGGDELAISASTLDGGPCTKADLDGEFTLETADGDPVYIHY